MTVRAGTFSLIRYLAIFYLIWFGYFMAVLLLVGGPGWVEARIKDLVWQIPVASAAMLGFQYRFAVETPEDQRTGFWSYKNSNLAFAGIIALTLIAILTVD